MKGDNSCPFLPVAKRLTINTNDKGEDEVVCGRRGGSEDDIFL
jgi:hypothetical protein